MKLKSLIFQSSLALVFLFFRCNCDRYVFWTDEAIDCHAKLYLTFVNYRQEPVKIALIDEHEASDSKISFSTNTMNILPDSLKHDTVTYKWTGNQECFFDMWLYKRDHAVTAKVFADDSLLESFCLFPWDTTQGLQTFCVWGPDQDCNQANEYWETVLIR